jgi:hypothetical protein
MPVESLQIATEEMIQAQCMQAQAAHQAMTLLLPMQQAAHVAYCDCDAQQHAVQCRKAQARLQGN